jgi:hypothetical protein
MMQLLTESRVAEAVFEGLPRDLPEPIAVDVPRVTLNLAADGIDEAARIERHRALLASIPTLLAGRSRSAIDATVIRRSALTPGVVLLFDLKTNASDGDVIERAPVAIHVALDLLPWPRRPTLIRQQIEEILPSLLGAVSGTLADLGRRQLERVRPVFLQALGRSKRREQAIWTRRDRAARQLVQAGLFDRRALRAAAPREADPQGLLEQSRAQRLEPGSEPSHVTASAELRGVLVVARR